MLWDRETKYIIAFLLLAGCTLNSSKNQLVPSYPNSESSKKQIAQKNSSNSLRAEQFTLLRQLNMRVIVPTYVPSGFQLAELKTEEKTFPKQDGGFNYMAFYMMIFQGSNNTCFRLMSGHQGFRDRPENQISVNTQSFGTIQVDYVDTHRPRSAVILRSQTQLPLAGFLQPK